MPRAHFARRAAQSEKNGELSLFFFISASCAFFREREQWFSRCVSFAPSPAAPLARRCLHTKRPSFAGVA